MFFVKDSKLTSIRWVGCSDRVVRYIRADSALQTKKQKILEQKADIGNTDRLVHKYQ
jgi:hypothetical protein